VLIGDFSSKDNRKGDKAPLEPTAQQMDSLTVLCQRLRHRYNIPVSRIVRHSDIGRTECPGDRFPYAEFYGKSTKLSEIGQMDAGDSTG